MRKALWRSTAAAIVATSPIRRKLTSTESEYAIARIARLYPEPHFGWACRRRRVIFSWAAIPRFMWKLRRAAPNARKGFVPSAARQSMRRRPRIPRCITFASVQRANGVSCGQNHKGGVDRRAIGSMIYHRWNSTLSSAARESKYKAVDCAAYDRRSAGAESLAPLCGRPLAVLVWIRVPACLFSTAWIARRWVPAGGRDVLPAKRFPHHDCAENFRTH